jgi:hypothetical protein
MAGPACEWALCRLRADPSGPAGRRGSSTGSPACPMGRGLAAEAGHVLANCAFGNGDEEVFAVVRLQGSAPYRHGVGRRDRQVLRTCARGPSGSAGAIER